VALFELDEPESLLVDEDSFFDSFFDSEVVEPSLFEASPLLFAASAFLPFELDRLSVL
jgi:hypothetical protein